MVKTNMYDNYQNIPSDYIPNNISPWVIPQDGVTDIIRGTNPDHFLIIPFSVSDIEKIVVTYTQKAVTSIEKVFVPNSSSSNATIETDSEGNNILNYSLTTSETTSLMAIDNTPCEIQMWVKLSTGKIVVSDKYFVHVLDSLYVEEEQDSEQ